MASAFSGPSGHSGTFSHTDHQSGPAFASAGMQLHHAPPKESVARSFSGPITPNIKDRTTGVPALIRANARVVLTASAHATAVDRIVLSALRRCDLLFPFHIFW
jgi:hypothetical protein